MDFSEFTWYAGKIEEESKDTKILSLLSEALSNAGEDRGVAALFFQGKTFPEESEKKMGIGQKTMFSVISSISGKSEEDIESAVAEVGGTGKVFTKYNMSETPQETLIESDGLSLQYVYNTFERVSQMSGGGSEQRKINAVSELFHDLSENTVNGDRITEEKQAMYLTRLILGEMRLGVGSGTIRDAISDAFSVDVDLVERSLMFVVDAKEVTEIAAAEGEEALQSLGVTVGEPIESMLAVKGSIEDAVEDWGETSVEKKFDGARLQIHKENDEVKLFTRNLEEVTDSLPDVVQIVKEKVDADTAIIDSEVVAYPSEDSSDPLPFNEVMKRIGRKYDIEEKKDEIHVDVHAFDLLYLEGNSYLETSARERHEKLSSVCPSLTAERLTTDDITEIKEFEATALADGNEGIMVKDPESEYSPGKRGREWRKIKPDQETIDCVVIGGELGEGRRSNLIGTYLLGVWDDGEIKEIGKMGTGITDERLEELTKLFEPLIIEQDGSKLTFEQEIVFEVGHEGIQPSPTYSSGYAMRFPRFLGIREDKRPEDADSVERIENLLG